MRNSYLGKLEISEANLNEITYVLVRKETTSSFNLSTYLKRNQGKEVGLVVNLNGKDIFCEVGMVEVINEVYMINGVDIGRALWNNTGVFLTIIVDDMEDKS
jgi:hypothetical protein